MAVVHTTKTYLLELSQKEAQYLRDLTGAQEAGQVPNEDIYNVLDSALS